MSNTSSTSRDSDPDSEPTGSFPFNLKFDTPLGHDYVATHVFLPVHLPEWNDYDAGKDHSLARAVCAASHAYSAHMDGTSEQTRWHRITKMLDNLQASVKSKYLDKGHVISQLREMRTGGTLTSSL